MAKPKEPFNPFYVALLLLGVAFTITACAYAMMAFRATRLEQSAADSNLITVLEQHGGTIMAAEVALLGLATVGAIALDQYRQRRKDRSVERGPT